MFFAENVLGRLFHTDAKNQSWSQVMRVQRPSEQQRMAFYQWMLTGAYQEANQAVLFGYVGLSQLQSWFEEVRFFTTESAYGFTLVFRKDADHSEVQHYFEYLKSRLLALDFCLQHSYCELSDHVLHVEKTDKYFWYSSHQSVADPLTEVTKGALTLEYVCINNSPSYCKLVMMPGDTKNNLSKHLYSLISTLFEF